MSFFSRLQNGWNLASVSFSLLNRNKSLLLFPVFSVVSFVVVLLSFFGGTYLLVGDEIEALFESERSGNLLAYGLIFLFYLINFFVIVFFNAALIHCAVKLLNGQETDLGDGLAFAWSRVGKILAWSVVSATVGTLLKALQSAGKIGEIVAGLIGIAWSVLTFFVVPVVIYENRDVFASIKESGRLMREKWGESIGANASFGLFHLLGLLGGIALGFALTTVHPVLGLLAGVGLIVLVSTVVTAARTVFVAAVYNRVTGAPTGDFDGDLLDSAFIRKG